MAIYQVTASGQDGTSGTGGFAPNTTYPTLDAEDNNSTGADTQGWANIDTSAIGTDTITAATLWWYQQSYQLSKFITQSRIVWISTTVIWTTTTTYANGWRSYTLTPSQLSLINKTGSTMFRWSVADPGGANYRRWLIRAWDYDSGASAAYVNITHAPAGGTPRTMILSV